MKLILLPGLDGTGKMFHPFIEELDSSFSTLIIPIKSIRYLSYDDIVDDIYDQLPLSEQFIFLAESFSGFILAKLLSKYDIKCKKIILVSSFFDTPKLLNSLSSFFISYIPIKFIPKHFVSKILFNGSIANENDFLNIIYSIESRVLKSRLKLIRTMNYRFLKRNYIECLYLNAENDFIIHNKNIRAVRKKYINTTVKTVSGGHLLLQSNPKESALIINRFLKD